ncbi:hypothetical protein AX14_010878, partial [Amanita brunnescens Koide BX004]
MPTSSDLWRNNVRQVSLVPLHLIYKLSGFSSQVAIVDILTSQPKNTSYILQRKRNKYTEMEETDLSRRGARLNLSTLHRITVRAAVLALLVPAMKIAIKVRLAIVNIVISEE